MIDYILSRSTPEPMSGCWLWDKSVYKNGYGQATFNHRKALAHRVSYELHRGPIPDGMCVLHKCDVKCCVNPDQPDRRGQDIPTARADEALVREIREAHKNGEAFHAIKRRTGLGYNAVRNIALRLSWKHIP